MPLAFYSAILLSLLPDITCPYSHSLARRFHFDELEAELEDWEVRLLRDFVHGKGRGIVSREPLSELLAKGNREDDFFLGSFPSPSPPSARMAQDHHFPPNSGPDFINIIPQDASRFLSPGGVLLPPSLPSPSPSFPPSYSPRPDPSRKRIRPVAMTTTLPSPSSSTSSSSRGAELKQLADLFQILIDRRKSENAAEIKEMVKAAPPAKTHETLLLTSSPKSIPKTEGSHLEWKLMNPEEGESMAEELMMPTSASAFPPPFAIQHDNEESKSEESGGGEEDWERKVRELSEQLATLLKKIKERRRRKPTKPLAPRVTVIRNGSAAGVASRQYSLVATITLVQDDGKNILVDTGLATDINARTDIIRRLEEAGVPPPAVHIVVTTHGHADHAGNLQEFPDALHFHSWFVHERTVFNLSSLFDLFWSEQAQLTRSVFLERAPGHTSEDIAVIVKDEAVLGNVAILGDVFLRREDIENPREWAPLSADERAQTQSRRSLLCKSDVIVPGHGPLFHVDSALRHLFKC